jgi:hypothetical protein
MGCRTPRAPGEPLDRSLGEDGNQGDRRFPTAATVLVER